MLWASSSPARNYFPLLPEDSRSCCASRLSHSAPSDHTVLDTYHLTGCHIFFFLLLSSLFSAFFPFLLPHFPFFPLPLSLPYFSLTYLPRQGRSGTVVCWEKCRLLKVARTYHASKSFLSGSLVGSWERYLTLSAPLPQWEEFYRSCSAVLKIRKRTSQSRVPGTQMVLSTWWPLGTHMMYRLVFGPGKGTKMRLMSGVEFSAGSTR